MTNHIWTSKIYNDKIIILTRELFDFFSNQKIIDKLAETSFIDEKKIKEVFKPHEKELARISGVCLLLVLKFQPEEKNKKGGLRPIIAIIFKERMKTKLMDFGAKIINFLPLAKFLSFLQGKMPKMTIPLPKISLPEREEIAADLKIRLTMIINKLNYRLSSLLKSFIPLFAKADKKKIILIIILILYLVFGYLFLNR